MVTERYPVKLVDNGHFDSVYGLITSDRKRVDLSLSQMFAILDDDTHWSNQSRKGLTRQEEAFLPIVIQKGLAVADPDESSEAEILVHYRGKAHQRMIKANTGLIARIAKRYLDQGLDLPELYDEGSIGVMIAADRYDPQRGTRFNTYAGWWIRQCIASAVGNTGRIIRLPLYKGQEVGRINRASAKLKQTLGRDPTYEEVADELEMLPESVESTVLASQPPVSFEQLVDEDDDGRERKSDEIVEDPTANFQAAADARLLILPAMEILNPLQREIVVLKYVYGYTNVEIGKETGFSREWIRQQLEIALINLRTMVRIQEDSVQ